MKFGHATWKKRKTIHDSWYKGLWNITNVASRCYTRGIWVKYTVCNKPHEKKTTRNSWEISKEEVTLVERGNYKKLGQKKKRLYDTFCVCWVTTWTNLSLSFFNYHFDFVTPGMSHVSNKLVASFNYANVYRCFPLRRPAALFLLSNNKIRFSVDVLTPTDEFSCRLWI